MMRRLIVAFMLALCLAAPAAAQTEAPKSGADRADDTEAERAAAVSVLLALADESRDWRDQALQARAQARVAHALWPVDSRRALGLFRQAWAAAQAVDEESERRAEEARRSFLEGRAGSAGMRIIPNPTNRRGEVIELAARRDPALAEEFITDLVTKESRESKDPMSAAEGARQRFAVAERLLEGGEKELAIQFADRALAGRVTVDSMRFLDRVRAKDSGASDVLYGMMVARARRDPAADGNTVSLLSSYVFTPRLCITFGRNGGSGMSAWDGPGLPPAAGPDVRAVFLDAAASILLRPLPPPDADTTTTGRAGLYMVITRLLPLFERFAPDTAAPLQSRRAQLLQETPEQVRGSKSLTRGLTDHEPLPGDDYEERLKNAKTDAERDEVHAHVAALLAERDPARAGEIALKIGDTSLRRDALAYLAFTAAKVALRKKDVEAARLAARAVELTRPQRVWIYAECALLLKDTDADQARELLEKAADEARRIEEPAEARAQALCAIATRTLDLDPERVWQAVTEFTRAANSARAFIGDEARVEARVVTARSFSTTEGNPRGFNVTWLFGRLSGQNFYQAVSAAKALEGEAARAAALVAVARAALSKELPRPRAAR